MKSMRSTWTDSRLDDLNGRVGELSRRMDDGFRRVDSEFHRTHDDIKELRAEMNRRFDSLQMTMLRFGGAMVVSLLGTMVAFFLTAH
jgi:hypothetical protein